jgi:hypothetical protein
LMGVARGPLRRRHSGKGRAVPERLPVGPYFVMRALSVAKASRSLCGAVQIENYRAKAKKFARLAAVAKSLRHSRQCRKLAEMYWALALGEEPERAPPSKTNVKRNTTWPLRSRVQCPQPRRPNDDYDDDEDADQEDGEQSDEPAVIREPEED